MNPESINQILETIKTFNFNFDSATSVELVNQVKPILYFYFIKGFVIDVLGLIAAVVAVYFVSMAVKTWWKKQDSNQ